MEDVDDSHGNLALEHHEDHGVLVCAAHPLGGVPLDPGGRHEDEEKVKYADTESEFQMDNIRRT